MFYSAMDRFVRMVVGVFICMPIDLISMFFEAWSDFFYYLELDEASSIALDMEMYFSVVSKDIYMKVSGHSFSETSSEEE